MELNLKNITVMIMNQKSNERIIEERIETCEACKRIYEKAEQLKIKVYVCNECDHIYRENRECSCRREEDERIKECEIECELCPNLNCSLRE